MDILIGILTIVLVLVSIAMVLVILMQRGSANGGLGAAMGGGMAESAFGAETGDVLSKITTKMAITFFVLVFGLYLGNLWNRSHSEEVEGAVLPEFAVDQPSSAENALQELLSQSAELEAETNSLAAGLETEIPAVEEETEAQAPVAE